VPSEDQCVSWSQPGPLSAACSYCYPLGIAVKVFLERYVAEMLRHLVLSDPSWVRMLLGILTGPITTIGSLAATANAKWHKRAGPQVQGRNATRYRRALAALESNDGNREQPKRIQRPIPKGLSEIMPFSPPARCQRSRGHRLSRGAIAASVPSWGRRPVQSACWCRCRYSSGALRPRCPEASSSACFRYAR
jgi:hypothetical protein